MATPDTKSSDIWCLKPQTDDLRNMDFLIVSDDAYAEPLKLAVRQIGKIYPDSKIFIYDWGLSPGVKSEVLQAFSEVHIEDWSDRIAQRKKRLRAGPKYALKSLLRGRNTAERHVFENVLIEKVACLEDCLQRFDPERLCWIDADVAPIARVDELEHLDFDALFTIRPEEEICFDFNVCQVINVGVVVVGSNRANRRRLVEHWLRETKATREYCREQTALTRLIERHKGRSVFKQDNEFDLELEGTAIRVALRPCQTYNYNWIERLLQDGVVSPRPKLLHFKGGRHQGDEFRQLCTDLEARGWI